MQVFQKYLNDVGIGTCNSTCVNHIEYIKIIASIILDT